jgi:A/G-specific adenine glycosylase
MLQQTQVPRVVPAYLAFLERFPTVASLAAASRRDVVAAWKGLGYNRRAVWLSEAARSIVREHDERVPSDPAALRRLPGVGSYTAAAVASFGFGEAVAVVDTNVRRVIARVHLGLDGHDVPARQVSALAQAWLDPAEPAAWNQALMDLGRAVCRPRPRCEVCPLARTCRFRTSGVRARPAPPRQGPFEGSTRQVRGAVVDVLRRHPSITLGRLAAETGFAVGRVRAAIRTLALDGLVHAGAAAFRGRAGGRVRLG